MRTGVVRGLLVSAVATGLIAAGCGDDETGDGDGIATSELSKQEWIAKANQVCAARDADTDRRAEHFFAAENATEERFARDVVAPGLERWADELEALGAPGGDEEQVRRMATVARRVAEQFRSADRPAEVRGAEGTETRRLFDEGAQLAAGLGIEAPCGDGSR